MVVQMIFNPYFIDEALRSHSVRLNYFILDISRKDKLDMLSARIQRDTWSADRDLLTVGCPDANSTAKLALG